MASAPPIIAVVDDRAAIVVRRDPIRPRGPEWYFFEFRRFDLAVARNSGMPRQFRAHLQMIDLLGSTIDVT
jgi:hypothetical protein